MQCDHELLKMANAPKWTSIDPLHRHWQKNSLAHYELAYSRRSGQWTVDSGQWIVDSGQWTVARNGERRKTNVEESKRERVGGPFALNP